MNSSNIGQIIRIERVRRGLSCRELADLSGTSAATISRIENGKRLSATPAILKIFKALDIHEDAEDQEPQFSAIDSTRLLPSIDFAIASSSGDDSYMIGFRNGLRYAKYLIDGRAPAYERMGDEK